MAPERRQFATRVPADNKESFIMPEENDAPQDAINDAPRDSIGEEGRGVIQFILELVRSGVAALRTVITSVVDTGRNLVSALVEWVLNAITSLVSSVAQRVLSRIATEV